MAVMAGGREQGAGRQGSKAVAENVDLYLKAGGSREKQLGISEAHPQ